MQLCVLKSLQGEAPRRLPKGVSVDEEEREREGRGNQFLQTLPSRTQSEGSRSEDEFTQIIDPSRTAAISICQRLARSPYPPAQNSHNDTRVRSQCGRGETTGQKNAQKDTMETKGGSACIVG
jgi:hypothetical protein